MTTGRRDTIFADASSLRVGVILKFIPPWIYNGCHVQVIRSRRPMVLPEPLESLFHCGWFWIKKAVVALLTLSNPLICSISQDITPLLYRMDKKNSSDYRWGDVGNLWGGLEMISFKTEKILRDYVFYTRWHHLHPLCYVDLFLRTWITILFQCCRVDFGIRETT